MAFNEGNVTDGRWFGYDAVYALDVSPAPMIAGGRTSTVVMPPTSASAASVAFLVSGKVTVELVPLPIRWLA